MHLCAEERDKNAIAITIDALIGEVMNRNSSRLWRTASSSNLEALKIVGWSQEEEWLRLCCKPNMEDVQSLAAGGDIIYTMAEWPDIASGGSHGL